MVNVYFKNDMLSDPDFAAGNRLGSIWAAVNVKQKEQGSEKYKLDS